MFIVMVNVSFRSLEFRVVAYMFPAWKVQQKKTTAWYALKMELY